MSGHQEMDITIFGALAEPNRLRIVELLRDGPLTVGAIAERTQMRQPQASKHLRILSEAGLVEVRAEGNRRFYQLRPEPFREMEAWLDSCRRAWEERFDRLDEYLKELQNQKGNRTPGE